MGETVDALVVGAYAHYLHSRNSPDNESPIQLATTDLGNVGEAYLLSFARSWMIIETESIRTKNRSKRSFHIWWSF